MSSSPPQTQSWQFSTNILLPVVLALLVLAAGVVGFVLWSTADVDSRALTQQSTIVSKVMAAQLSGLTNDRESVTIWDDAVHNTKQDFNFDWVDANLGQWMYQSEGSNQIVVLDAVNTPIYMMTNGQVMSLENYAGLAPAIQPLIDRLRLKISTGGMEPFNSGTSALPASVSDFAVIDGLPAVVSVLPIVSGSRTIQQAAGTEALVVDILSLDQEFADGVAEDYLFEDAAFTLSQTTDTEKSAFPLVNDGGRIVGFFEWRRDRPGLMMLEQTGPVLAVAFSVACGLVFLLLRQLHRSTEALEADRAHAEHEASHDRLTGLTSRMGFDRELARTLRVAPSGGGQIALLMLDLDRFKHVNDTMGHQAGDQLLFTVGQRLRAQADTGAIIARLGGDEFAIMMTARKDATDLLALAAKIIYAVEQPFDIDRGKAHVGVSIGIVTTATGGNEPRELMRKADIALYQAKTGGRNRAVVYEEHMNDMLQLQHTIEGELREALRRDDQLSVVFQPLIDQASRKVIGAEALSRWSHPKFGQVSPGRFIPVAESSGLIESLGDFVLRRACQLGAKAPGFTIAVNISPTQLRNPKFAARVFEILQHTGMEPRDLELEITESILLEEEHISSQNLRTFRAAGIQVALDDFGTGYSSLGYLQRYAVDRIKIDRSFVNQLTDGHVSVAIVQAMMTLAHAMGIAVTAEGVETAEQARILGRLGCNTFQGFLFSAAVSRERIKAIFAEPAGVIAAPSKVA